MTDGGGDGKRRRETRVKGLVWVVLLLLGLSEGFWIRTVSGFNHDCNSEQFACSDSSCIDSKWVCDGQFDCDMGEDEFCDRMLGGSSSSSSTSTSTSTTPGAGNRQGYQSNRCEIPKTDPSGTIISPNFPLMYEENFSCDYVFIAEPGHQIRLNFTFFDLECSTCACCEMVQLREPSSGSVDSFCCTDSPGVYTSAENVLIMRFTTRPSDRSYVPEGAMAGEAYMLDDGTGMSALGRAAANGMTHGYRMNYKQIISKL